MKSIGEGLPFGLEAFEFELAPALRVARAGGEEPGIARYERALSLAAAFVMQNGYHAHNSYALPNPVRAQGGFRRTPLDCSLDIEDAGHCARFLLEWARLQKRE